jgi:DegV family protein with EDD domain
MKYLDGIRLRRAVDAGWRWLDQYRENINAINVFPVADGDTGTNMALTLKAAVAGAETAKSESLQDVADAIALHSLRGAQGNSGVILSQYFNGIARYIRMRERLNLDEVAGVFSAGADSAYGALKEPREGTILTVIREMAEHLQETKNRFTSLKSLLQSAIDRGKESLAETRSKLQVLSDAGVVDAGGQGFVHFIEGIGHFIRTGELAQKSNQDEMGEVAPGSIVEHSSFRYCSEFLMKGTAFDTDFIKGRLANLGDSLIVACAGTGTERYLRIHIHTDQPERVRDFALTLGKLETSKIDDMKVQNKSMLSRREGYRRNTTKTVKVVTDSTSDLPRELAEFHDIEVIPLRLTFGSDIYRDGIDLGRDRFYRMLAESAELPTTSQPSPGEFSEVYERIFNRGERESVVSIHLSAKLSGTFNSAQIGGRGFGDKVRYFDSGSASMGLGMQAIVAAEMARDGHSAEEIIRNLERLKKGQRLFFTLGGVEYLIKGGRVGGAKGFLGKLLGLKPLLSLVDGEIIPIGKARSEDKLLEKIISILDGDVSGGRWAVGHAAVPSILNKIIPVLKDRFKAEKIISGEIGPTVGTHAGPGTWGIFYMKG